MDGSVTQITNSVTPVTINVACGIINTVSLTTAAGTAATFQVNNTGVDADSVILAQIIGYTGAYGPGGVPIVFIGNVATGSFVIALHNAHATNALSGVVKIGFQIL